MNLTKYEGKNIYQRILSVMAEVDYIQKGDKMVNGQYRFVGHDQVTAIIHPQLVKHGIAVLPTVVGSKQDGNRTEVVLSTTFVNVDDPMDRIEIKTLGYGIDQGDKGPGKAVSYAFKYAVLKTFSLETGDDPDMDANASYSAPQPLEDVADMAIELHAKCPDQNGKPLVSMIQMSKYVSFLAGKNKLEEKAVLTHALKSPERFFETAQTWLKS